MYTPAQKAQLTREAERGTRPLVSPHADTDTEDVLESQPSPLVTAKPLSLNARVTGLELTVAALADALLDADALLAPLSGPAPALSRARIRRALAPRVTLQLELFEAVPVGESHGS